MSSVKKIASELARAALQLTLPFLDTAQPPQVSKVGARLARLNGSFVEYELRKSRRRTIGFVIDGRGLAVTAPMHVSQTQVDAALQERADWILRKLVEWREYEARRDRFTVRWEHGSSFPFLGSQITIQVDPGHRGAPLLDDGTLRLALPPQAGEEQLRDTIHGWIQKHARRHFAERLVHFEHVHGLTPTKWALSSARTRWGSCHADGSIRLNWRLMHFPLHVIDYVIAHELAHLRELNHGPQFWKTVGELFPDYRQARDWLRSFPDDHPVA